MWLERVARLARQPGVNFGPRHTLIGLHHMHRGFHLGFGRAVQDRQTEELLPYIVCPAAFHENVERAVRRLLTWTDRKFARIHGESSLFPPADRAGFCGTAN